MLEIKLNKLVSKETAVITKTEYNAKDSKNGFEATVTVSEHKRTPAYVSWIDCGIGEEKLNCFKFWSDLQIEVLNIHNKK